MPGKPGHVTRCINGWMYGWMTLYVGIRRVGSRV